ncbi:HEAT repeat domain-containing protein [Halorubrum ezzemoulense]|uniref:HEAT repeat domain-containing protein n=1 Tax=Halorubrum ezzemoulense TaxID=337243 RepID=UPI00232F074B|nr:HEAT repeat domain-containing protein [Halorubrum ezzemoulense]MDB2250000.1 HEAT repeat domain-containing protein [Halorubrum ezzemoulense]
MLVFAFDRDWTVDVNPHPRHEAVPLEWVRHLAHETPHRVYAIGNQTLAEEAAIPGIVDIVGRHPDEWDEWLGEKQPTGRYERFPLRRERLALIADLHPDADDYIVVDDLDLNDVDGWEHYHAWEFVPAVKQGQIHPDPPWARDLEADGGLPTSAGIMPADASSLSSFLDEHADAVGFEITYLDDGVERTRLCHTVSMDAVALERPSAAPALQCTPLAPGDDQFTVPVDKIELLSVVFPPPSLYTAGAETPAEEAVGLRRLANTQPEEVRISSLLTLLDRDDGDIRQDENALRALRQVVKVRPADCTPAIPILQTLLDDGDHPARADVLATLRIIGDTDPGAIAPLADDLVPCLDSNIVSIRREATRCVATIAAEYPDDVVDAVPTLTPIIEDEADALPYAVYALSRITREYPDAVKPAADSLGDVILDDSLSDTVRLNATAGLGRVVGEYPSIAVDIVDDVATLLSAEDRQLRNNAIALIGDVAIIHSDVVEPYSEEISELLTVDDTYTRVNASGALSRVAEDFPDSVANVTSTFIELLSDDDPRVRENACWALGYLAAQDATSTLKDRAHGDENADVRTRASWALNQING